MIQRKQERVNTPILHVIFLLEGRKHDRRIPPKLPLLMRLHIQHNRPPQIQSMHLLR